MRFLTIFLLELLAIGSLISISFCNGNAHVDCIQTERDALLALKRDLKDPQNRLVSWNSNSDGNCCRWAGVTCDNFTGYVLKLNLRNPVDDSEAFSYTDFMLSGKINPSLLALKHLNHLDLSGNNFGGSQVPKFLGFMRNLRYLKLSFAGFSGMVPYQLGNLSHLQYLDIMSSEPNLFIENSQWLSGLFSLKHLDLSGVNLEKASELLHVTSSIPSLNVLYLSSCQLRHFTPPSIVNFSSLSALDISSNQFDNARVPSFISGLKNLVFLDLSDNGFQGSLPDGLQNLTYLRHLRLSHNNFSSPIPNWLYKLHLLEFFAMVNTCLQGTVSPDVGNLTSMVGLDLSNNHLEGKIPSSFGKLCKLRTLRLTRNKLVQDISEIFRFFSGCLSDSLELLQLNVNKISGHLGDEIGTFRNLDTLLLGENLISGPISLSLGNLSSLKFLDLSFNKLNATISEAHFVNLRNLLMFDATETLLTFKVSPNWVPPFQLQYLVISSCNIGSPFPSWLQSQQSLLYLDASNNAGVFNNIPDVFWKALPKIKHLNLSGNYIQGSLPNLLEVAPQLKLLELSSNNFSGEIPVMPSNLHSLGLSHNKFSGSISQLLSCRMSKPKSLQFLDLRSNFLSKELPDCWMNLQSLSYLNLANNRFSGNLPTSLGALRLLKSLHLQRNNFSGTLPPSLKYCTGLISLDISENEFSGYFPSWIGEKFSNLMILNLRSNKFYGSLPEELCGLASLQILDLSCNNLSGFIPKCVNNLSAMVEASYSVDNYILYSYQYYFPGMFSSVVKDFVEDASVIAKGKKVDYSRTLNLVRNFDLSNNNLSGEIPVEVMTLSHYNGLIYPTILYAEEFENAGVNRSLQKSTLW